MPFKVIQGHRFWYQSKRHMRRVSGKRLPLQNLEGLSYQMLKTARLYLYSSGQNTGTERDGMTDRRTENNGLSSGLHYEECGRAVKMNRQSTSK